MRVFRRSILCVLFLISGIEHIDDLVADLDQAMRKAMDKVGHPAVAGGAREAVGNGDGNEKNLLQRIRQLEDMVRVLSGRGSDYINGKR